MKNLYIHIGFPRTGTTTLQLHLFPNHPQINFLGRTPRTQPQIKMIDLVCNLNNHDFEKSYKEILEMCSAYILDDNKINVLSQEFIISYATHYNHALDKNNNVYRTLKRLDKLFEKLNINLEFFCTIRNQATIIPSFYSATSPELKRSMKYDSNDIINFLKKNEVDNFKIKNLLNSYKYWELNKNFGVTFSGKKKLKFFIYEEYENELPIHISKYLGIDENITKNLIKGKIENSSRAVLKEHPLINSKFEIITNKIFKNLSSPKLLLYKFDKKIFNFFLLIKDLILRKNRNLKDNNKHTYNKKIYINKLDILKKNSKLIKEFYREDNLKFMNDLNIDIKKHDYF